MHGAKDHFDPTPPPLRLVGGPDDYDALAELFLGGEPRASRRVGAGSDEPEDAPVEREPEAPPRPQVVVIPQAGARTAGPAPMEQGTATIEALILGHLPVRSSPWVSQYARARAEQLRRPVCLLRVQGDQASLDIFGASEKVELCPEFGASIDRAREIAQDWIVQVDELNEPALAADDRLHAITLLTSANETAVIAAYRAIKGLASAQSEGGDEQAHSGRGVDGEHPELRVGIMGASPAESQAAMARLRNACSVFLGKPLELAASVERVGPSGGVPLYRGMLSTDLPAILTSVSQPTPARAPVTAPATTAEPVREAEPAPVVRAVQAPTDPAAAASESLAEHVPGLTLLAARCPDDSSIELAVDGQGRLNLLRRGDAPDACQRLMAAVGWAARHAQLIALTAPSATPLDVATPPVGRLFVDDPKAYRPMLDSSVRLHLLARASADSPWLCLELN